MRWVSLGSIGLIAFMGCTGPVAAQQTQSRPKPRRGATRALLLASTALATGIFAGAMVNPQTAQARCTPSRAPFAPPERTFVWNDRVEGQVVNVTCDTDTTTSDLTIGLPAPAIGVPVNGLISPGVT